MYPVRPCYEELYGLEWLMVNLELAFHLLLLLLAANGVPILARNIFEGYADWPVDRGYVAVDGNRLLGDTKTWRGLFSSIVVTSLLGLVLGYSLVAGALFALYSLVGDMLSSFIKRRLGMPPSSRATGLDQLPEAILPLLMLQKYFVLEPVTFAVTVLTFMLLEIVLSKLLFTVHVRRRPY